MMSNAVVHALTNYQVHFALMGSDFDQEGKKKLTIERIHKYDRIFSLYGTLIFNQHTPFHTAYVICHNITYFCIQIPWSVFVNFKGKVPAKIETLISS